MSAYSSEGQFHNLRQIFSESPNPLKKYFKVTYFEKEILFKPLNETIVNTTIPSYFQFSNNGQQILKHLSPICNENYFTWLQENYKIDNYEVQNI